MNLGGLALPTCLAVQMKSVGLQSQVLQEAADLQVSLLAVLLAARKVWMLLLNAEFAVQAHLQLALCPTRGAEENSDQESQILLTTRMKILEIAVGAVFVRPSGSPFNPHPQRLTIFHLLILGRRRNLK